MPPSTTIYGALEIGELLDALEDPNLSTEERNRLEGELDRMVWVRDSNADSSLIPDRLVMQSVAKVIAKAFISPSLDVDAIYRRRCVLDRCLLGRVLPTF